MKHFINKTRDIIATDEHMAIISIRPHRGENIALARPNNGTANIMRLDANLGRVIPSDTLDLDTVLEIKVMEDIYLT